MAKTQLVVDPETLVVKVNADANLQVEVDSGATYTVTANNSNVSITDNDSGDGKKITGVTAGTAVLTVTATKEGEDNNVIEVPVVIDNADGTPLLTVENTTLTIKEADGIKTINVTTTVDDFTVKANNDNVTVAKVEGQKQITITPVKGGESVVTIEATSKSSVKGTLTLNVTVVAKPTLEVTPATATFKVNKTQVLDIQTNQSDFGYVISPEDLVTFDKNSKTLTGVKVGTGKITIYVNKDQEGELSKEVQLTIEEPDITTLDVTPTNPTIVVGGTVKLTVTSNDPNYRVSNTNTTAVTFTKETGIVEANAVGSATLTFTAKYGEGEELTKQVIVTVEAAPVEPTTLVVTPSDPISLIKGDTKVFEVNTNADDYEVEIESSSIASYNKSTHTLTTLEAGSTSVKFKAQLTGSDLKEVTVLVNVADTNLVASENKLEVQTGNETSFTITSNIVGEVKVSTDDEEKIAVSKNNNTIFVNGLEVGEANVILTARDRTLTIPVKVFDVTLLSVSNKPNKVYVGKDLTVDVTTNATEFTVESVDPAIVKVIKVNNQVIISSQADGKTTIKIKAQVNGGDEVVVEWEITSILETSYTKEESDKLLTDPNTTVAEKLNKFSNDVGEYGKFVNNLISYNESMNPSNEVALSDEKGAAKNYNLYIQIKDAIETEDYAAFKVKFDVINMAYTEFSKGAFDEFALFRYDQAWSAKWGDVSLVTFQNLNTLICTLCNIKTRAAALSSLDLDKALDPTVLELTELGINNIKKYYVV